MKSKTRLDSAVFQLTPTRTRCDLYIIANDKKEKIASGLLNPFIAHLKAAQDQIAQGGYSVLLAPQAGTNATWFTKSTLESFVRFVSTPEILERVYTIESEILQIEEAIAIQGNNDMLIEDQHVKPVVSSEGNKPTHDADEDKAIVLYKPGAHETTNSSAKEGNSKVELLNVLETRKSVLKKEQGMAFARAVAAGFEIEHVANLLSFAECFGASRLMSGCLRFMDLWKQKHESGQWVEVVAEAEAEDSKSDYSASGVVLSNSNIHNDATSGTDPNAVGGQFPHPGFPPWGPGVPVYQPYPVPYYPQTPFYAPPSYSYPPMDINYNNNEESPEQHKNAAAGKKKSGKVVIRNINFINSKTHNSSESPSDTDTGDETETETKNYTQKKSSKRKGNRKASESEALKGKETDNGHWDAFQNYLLKGAGAAEEDMFAMEKDSKTKRLQKSMDDDPLANAERDGDGEGHRVDMQSYDRNGRKIVYRSGNDDFIMGRREQANTRDPFGLDLEGATANFDRNDLYIVTDEAFMVSTTSGVNDNNRSSINMDTYELTSQNQENKQAVKYEPDALSLMPERDLEKRSIGYDPALDYEMQLAEDAASASASALREKKSKTQVKKVSKSAEKHQQSQAVRKGKPSKVNNALEDARARAEKLRSYKADLQKMKKEQQDAEVKRLEALKMERQKRIAARANTSRQQQLQLQSPMSHSHRGSKFTDSEPGSSSPLQRSKIRPASTNSKKPLTNSKSKLVDGNHSAGNSRLTRSLSSMSDTKKEIRRLSEPRKTNNNSITRSAEAVSKSKKISSAIDQSKAKAAELKMRTSKVSSNLSQKVNVKEKEKACEVGKVNLHEKPIIDKSVVMLENKQQQASSNLGTGTGTRVKVEIVDKALHPPQKHPTSTSISISTEVRKTCVEEKVTETETETEMGGEYEAPYARISSFEDPSTRNSDYAKAPPCSKFETGTEKAFVSDFNNLKLEKIPEKPPQPKGFRRLLKLGKKNQHLTFSAPAPVAQVHTLKTLISEDQTPTHGQTSQKSSRHFSLLSSLRGKTTEKKPTT